ncbi:Regulator of G protein signaling superfamily [Penicillium soppii]|uniref:Regulator of G protein signaling superfamily n=1 Tax=Penicillium soppii TaxID=69789 RepID=UPI0025467D38|nr:Regulator of G protein signaling superfamily [Penicillium soppii]KAJ5852000.1 Regulator of G protein signaling superfamily [Penicillium soppii]
MLKKKTLAPSLFFRSHTPSTTPELSPTSSDSDSEEDMESSGSRPVSLVGAFSMRPTLDEVLANVAPPPYTLSAFMAYLSQNHCLETLEFTLEANRYRESYYAIIDRSGPNALAAESSESQHMRMLWQRLLAAYIFPGSPREINLSSEVRDALLQYSNVSAPPNPEILDSAVKRIHDLMEESIFLPFINSHTTSPSMVPSEPLMAPDDILNLSSSTLDEHPMKRVRSRVSKRISPQSSLKDLPATGHSRSTMSLGVHAIGKRASGALLSTSTESASLTDDSSPQSSPTAEEPMTPPTTPPASEQHLPIQSPKLRTENTWKKMGMKLGFKKRSTTGSGASRDPKILGLDE